MVRLEASVRKWVLVAGLVRLKVVRLQVPGRKWVLVARLVRLQLVRLQASGPRWVLVARLVRLQLVRGQVPSLQKTPNPPKPLSYIANFIIYIYI